MIFVIGALVLGFGAGIIVGQSSITGPLDRDIKNWLDEQDKARRYEFPSANVRRVLRRANGLRVDP